jgi:hypothetical protein
MAGMAAMELLSPQEARAQASAARQVTPQDAWNPRPDDGDFVLPLPCELSMAFRPVFIPVKGYLGELEGYFGSESQAEGDRTESLNRRRKAYVGSALSLENLPEACRPKAEKVKADAKPGKEPLQLYLIGKYEITNAQWDALNGEGRAFDPRTAALPKAGISWHEAQSFTARLTGWLLRNAPEALPS